jgi:hypothetical protein
VQRAAPNNIARSAYLNDQLLAETREAGGEAGEPEEGRDLTSNKQRRRDREVVLTIIVQ